MKANELMVGDWVLAEGKLTQVTDIDEFDGINRRWIAGCEDGGCIREEDIKPITLNPDILDKNKFPYIPKADGYFVGDLFLKGNGDIGYSCGANIRIDNGDGIVGGIYYTFAKIRYVHELQHALRLCGIKKDIVL